jgi:hypothetical protein
MLDLHKRKDTVVIVLMMIISFCIPALSLFHSLLLGSLVMRLFFHLSLFEIKLICGVVL